GLNSYSPSVGAGGRVSIKYNTVTDITTLKNNITSTGPGSAGEGTIYLKNNTTNDEYLLIKGDGSTTRNTTVGTGYNDYYFDTIEVTDGAKFYKQGSENIIAGLCILGGTPVGVVGPGIICNGVSSYKYYDLNISIKKFDLRNRKHELLITGPSGGYELIGSGTGVINGNGNFTKKIKITKTGTYTFTFKLYDSNDENALVKKTVIKTVNVTN
ncbi:MAG: hypothetical protein PHS49_04020, partial [Candidatus Gracilibacteria bacterium]|nr:hypothetical protein [Candidatus Gracilibacteria bacterium]